MALTYAQIAAAIGTGEGYGASATNIPTRLNNPGDLTVQAVPAGAAGVTGSQSGFAQFTSASAGTAALEQYLANALPPSGSPGLGLSPNSTLADFLNVYANNPDSSYIETVAAGLGVPSTIPLGQLQSLIDPTSAPGVVAGSGASTDAATGAIVTIPSAGADWTMIAAIAGGALLLLWAIL